MELTRATAAVSRRNVLGPRLTGLNPAQISARLSTLSHPPSGPTTAKIRRISGPRSDRKFLMELEASRSNPNIVRLSPAAQSSTSSEAKKLSRSSKISISGVLTRPHWQIASPAILDQCCFFFSAVSRKTVLAPHRPENSQANNAQFGRLPYNQVHRIRAGHREAEGNPQR